MSWRSLWSKRGRRRWRLRPETELAFAPRADMGLLAFGFILVVGVALGSIRLAKAARLDPIEALRYE